MDIQPLLRRQQLVERIESIKEGKRMTWEQVAKSLYQILDDISTTSDWCKGNTKAFMENVLRISALRNQYLTSPDGRTLERVNEDLKGAGSKEILLTNTKLKALVDPEDYGRVSKLSWYLKKDKRTNVHYVAHGQRVNGVVKTIRLHRFVMNAGPELDVHHKDLNPLNCQKDNLEVVPKEEHRNYHTHRQYSRVAYRADEGVLNEAALPRVQSEIKNRVGVSSTLPIADVRVNQEQFKKFLILIDGSVIPVSSLHEETIAGLDHNDPEFQDVLAPKFSEFQKTGGVRGDFNISTFELDLEFADGHTLNQAQISSILQLASKNRVVSLVLEGGGQVGRVKVPSFDALKSVVSGDLSLKDLEDVNESIRESKHLWTAFITWDPDWKEGMEADEEIDVEADGEIDAKLKAEKLLKSDYAPGGRIVGLIERPNGWVFGTLPESKMTDWARNELQMAGLFDKDSDYEGMLGEAVMDLLDKFSEQGHSGFSAELTASIFDRLVRWKPLSELTNDPNEWMEITEHQEARTPGLKGQVRVYQSRRSPDCFSEDGGQTYYSVDDPCFEFVDESGIKCMRYCPETWAKVTFHTSKKKV